MASPKIHQGKAQPLNAVQKRCNRIPFKAKKKDTSHKTRSLRRGNYSPNIVY